MRRRFQMDIREEDEWMFQMAGPTGPSEVQVIRAAMFLYVTVMKKFKVKDIFTVLSSAQTAFLLLLSIRDNFNEGGKIVFFDRNGGVISEFNPDPFLE